MDKRVKFIVVTPDGMSGINGEHEEGTTKEAVVKKLASAGVYEFRLYECVGEFRRKVELEEVKLDG